MGDLIDRAGEILAQSQRIVDVASQNIANLGTSGYKRKVPFLTLLESGRNVSDAKERVSVYQDFAQGALGQTGSPLDLAISGAGFFVIRTDGHNVYARNGQFHRDGNGRLLSVDGYPLQAVGGGDIVLKEGDFKVSLDGTVFQSGESSGQIALVEPDHREQLAGTTGGFYLSGDGRTHDVQTPVIHQAMAEASNSTNGQEMTMVIEAMRRAETGQQIAHVYDDLVGKAISGFGG